jgi:hypothetical protein
MLLDTSSAMMIVALFDGIETVATGLLNAKTRLVNASRNNANGKCLRQRDWCAAASRTSERLEKRTANRFLRRNNQMYKAVISGIRSNKMNDPDQRKLIAQLQNPCEGFKPSQGRFYLRHASKPEQ